MSLLWSNMSVTTGQRTVKAVQQEKINGIK